MSEDRQPTGNPLAKQVSGVGLVVDLRQANPTHLPNGNRDFISMQGLFMEDLRRFFPKVEVQGDSAVFQFVKREGGEEIAAGSQSINEARVPTSELKSLERAWKTFLARKSDPNTAPRAREVIEHFRFPDPDLDADFYRVYGATWNRRLLLIWGLESKMGSSLPFDQMLLKLRRRVRPAWVAPLCLLGFLALLIFPAYVATSLLFSHRPAINMARGPTNAAPVVPQSSTLTSNSSQIARVAIQDGNPVSPLSAHPATRTLTQAATSNLTVSGTGGPGTTPVAGQRDASTPTAAGPQNPINLPLAAVLEIPQLGRSIGSKQLGTTNLLATAGGDSGAQSPQTNTASPPPRPAPEPIAEQAQGPPVTADYLVSSSSPTANSPPPEHGAEGLLFKTQNADPLSHPLPTYPRSEQAANHRGRVALLVVVGSTGRPESVSVETSSGWPSLDRHATDWVRQKWRWPAGETRRYLLGMDFK